MGKHRTKTNGPTQSAFRPLRRSDLTTFDREARDLILGAIDAGCTGRISSRGHAILRNNTGGTTSVPRNMTSPNRTAQNARADMRRLLAEHRSAPTNAESAVRGGHEPRQMTVSQAFVEIGAAFSAWFDRQADGLSADQLIDVEYDEDGQPCFTAVPTQEPPAAETPAAPEPAPEARAAAHLPDLRQAREICRGAGLASAHSPPANP